MSTTGRSRCASFRWEPQPAALVTIISAPGRGERGSRPARELEALLAAAGVERERAAAAVVGRRDLVAVGGEHAGRRAVDLAEEHRLHAAREQADARDRRSPTAGVSAGGATASRQAGASSLSGLNGPGAGSELNLSASFSRFGFGKTAKTSERSSRSPTGRGTSCSTRSRASSISRSYWTPEGHEVRQAMQPRQRSKCSATVWFSSSVPVERRLHQPDPAARRVHLLVPELVGRARRQAEAAVDAVVDQARVHQASIPSGSNEARTRSASGDHARSLGLVDVRDPGPGPREAALLPVERRPGRRRRPERRRSPPRPRRRPALRGRRPPARRPRPSALRRGTRSARPAGSRRRSARAASGGSRAQSARGSSVSATTVASAAGRGWSRSATRAISPSRPREPEKSLPRS